jgi:hypothetical protein
MRAYRRMRAYLRGGRHPGRVPRAAHAAHLQAEAWAAGAKALDSSRYRRHD